VPKKLIADWNVKECALHLLTHRMICLTIIAGSKSRFALRRPKWTGRLVRPPQPIVLLLRRNVIVLIFVLSRLKSIAKRLASPDKWFNGKAKSDAEDKEESNFP